MTFNDLSRPQMTSDPKNSNRFICSLVSAFQKHIGWKKSKKSLFRSIFKYEQAGAELCQAQGKLRPQKILGPKIFFGSKIFGIQ